MGVHVFRSLKEELAWATDERLQVSVMPLYSLVSGTKE